MLIFRAIEAEDAEAAAEGLGVAQRAVSALADDDEAAFLAAVDALSMCAEGYAASALMYTLLEALGPMVKADRTWFSKRLLEAAEGFRVVLASVPGPLVSRRLPASSASDET